MECSDLVGVAWAREILSLSFSASVVVDTVGVAWRFASVDDCIINTSCIGICDFAEGGDDDDDDDGGR